MWSSVRERFPVWYFDSSGGVIKKVENQSAPFLFSIVFHDKDKKLIMPLAEFISTAHDSHVISGYLYTIKLELERTLSKKSFQIAPIICTDFSFALLNAVCSVFNNCTLEFYLKWCFEVLFKKAKSISIGNSMKVVLHLCGAHFLKMIVKKVKNIKKYKEDLKEGKEAYRCMKKNKNLQKSFIFAFTILQNSTKLDDFIENFIHVHNIYNIKYHSKKITDSLRSIKKQLIEREGEILSIKTESIEPDLIFQKEEDKYHEYAKYNSFDKNDESSLKKKSMFDSFFKMLLKQIAENTLNDPSVKLIANEFYCPEMFKIIAEYLYALPLWSLLSIGRWQQINPKFDLTKNLTNNAVENWFDQVKNGILQTKVSMPSLHASKMDNKIEAEYELHYRNENITLNKSTNSLAFKKEKWKTCKKRHVKGSYLKGLGVDLLFGDFGIVLTNAPDGTVFSDTEREFFIVNSWFYFFY